MVIVGFTQRPHAIEDLLGDLRKGRVSKETEVRDFYLWGTIAIVVDGTGLFRPPVWREECLDATCGPETGIMDFFWWISKALARLEASDAAEEKYYFVEHDYSITLLRRGDKLLLTATLEFDDEPSTPALTADFAEFYMAVACAAKRFLTTLAPWDETLQGHVVVRKVLSEIKRLADICVSQD